MERINEILLDIVASVNTYLSNYVLLIMLIGCGLIFTFKTKFVQVRCFGEGFKKVFGNIKLFGGKQSGGLSSFQALATAIAAQVGTGNIVGACGAIIVGGPGAIFWMWVIAFFGMATIYAEAVLAQDTKVVDENGNVAGGPVYYIKKAFNNKLGKFLAVFFAVAAMLALGFMGSMVQSNSIAEACNTAFGAPNWVIGVIVAVVAGFIFLGGVQRIASVTEKLVPVMACLYLIGGIVILAWRVKYIPETFGMIFRFAFQPQAILGGGFGAAITAAITQGAKRGLFSNEAGMGSTPHAHALANVEKPHDQGVAAMIGVFIDTFVVLTMTALIVISSLYTGDGVLAGIVNSGAGDFASAAEALGVTKNNMVQVAFQGLLGDKIGGIFVAICLLFFAFSTIISWNYFGKINFEYLFGKKATFVYSIIAVLFVFTGSILSSNLVWELTDMFNNLMVIPNVIAIVALSGIVAAAANNKKK